MGDQEEYLSNNSELNSKLDLENLDRIGAIISRLKDDSDLDEVDQKEVEEFKKFFPNEFQNKKINQIEAINPQNKARTVNETVNNGNEKFENDEAEILEDDPLSIDDLNNEISLIDQSQEDQSEALDSELDNLLDPSLENISDNLSGDLENNNSNADLVNEDLEQNVSDETKNEVESQVRQEELLLSDTLNKVEDIPFDIPTVEGGLELEEFEETEKESRDQTTPQTELIGDADDENKNFFTERDEQVVENEADEDPQKEIEEYELDQASQSDAPIDGDVDLNLNDEITRQDEVDLDGVAGKVDEETEVVDDEVVAEEQDEEVVSSYELEGGEDKKDEDKETILELDLLQESTPNINVSNLSEEDYQRAMLLLNKFAPKNKELILKAIQKRELNEQQSQEIFEDIISNKNETRIAEKVSSLVLKNGDYFEILERREKILEEEKSDSDNLFEKIQLSRRIRRLTFFLTFLLIVLLGTYFSYDHILAFRLYHKALENVAEQKYELGEEYFRLATEREIHLYRYIEMGNLYYQQREIERAQKKYQTALQLAPDDLQAQIAYGNFFFLNKDYEEADRFFKIAEKSHPSESIVKEYLGENYIEWGKQDPEQWVKANQIYTELLSSGSGEVKKYLAKKLELYSLENDYYKAKFYYELINKQDDNYHPLKPYAAYVDFLLRTYRNRDKDGNPILNQSILENREDGFIVATIDDLLNDLYQSYPQSAIVYYQIALWKNLNGYTEEAIRFAEMGTLNIPSQKVSYYFSGESLFVLLGRFLLEENKNIAAEKKFLQALVVNPDNPMANYYLGKINLIDHQNYKKADFYLVTSLENWGDYDDLEKIDLIYSLGYLSYLQGKKEEEKQESQKYFSESLNYWGQLVDKVNPKADFLVDYCVALSYLQLRQYDLAEIFLSSQLDELKALLPIYEENEESALNEVRFRLHVLSDIYNNLGVAQTEKYFQEKNNFRLLQSGLENFINSISLKDKLNLIKGIPYANFNTLNDYSRTEEKFNISQERFLNERKLRIADDFIPPSIL